MKGKETGGRNRQWKLKIRDVFNKVRVELEGYCDGRVFNFFRMTETEKDGGGRKDEGNERTR